MSPSSQNLTLRDLPCRLLTWTPERESRPPLVLIHGFADTAATWDAVAEPLARMGHRVIAPDLRGFGASGWVGAGGYYHFPDYVADLDALVRMLGLGSFFLVGHSMGGTVATQFAGARPALVARLALLEGLGPPDNDPAHTPDRFARWLDDLIDGGRSRQRSLSRDEALDRLARQHPGVDPAILSQRLPHLLQEQEPGQFRWHLDPLHRTTSPVPFLVATYRAFAARVACPVLLVDGGTEGFHPADEAERIAAFRHHEVRSLVGAGHMMHWTQPEALADALGAFFGGAP